jgi:hypothetical protein
MKNKTQGVNVFTDKVPNYGLSLSTYAIPTAQMVWDLDALCSQSLYLREAIGTVRNSP